MKASGWGSARSSKILIAIAECLLICAGAFSQTISSSKLSIREIKAAALESADYGRCSALLSALGRELPIESNSGEYEIPPICWTDHLKELKPVKVYFHRLNAAIVMSVRDGMEEGIYIYNAPISSYASITRFQDGFEFVRDKEEPNLYYFKRRK